MSRLINIINRYNSLYVVDEYEDKAIVNVLHGTNATFKYTDYPLNQLHRIIFDKVENPIKEYFTCAPNLTVDRCIYESDRITYVEPENQYPYIVLHDVTGADAGLYNTRIVRENKKVDPLAVDVKTTLSVFTGRCITIEIRL